jgi:RpiR family transcriptional regulator, carbohydrate utilization regulator
MSTSFLARISERRAELRKSERKVADVVLADPRSVITMTLAELAEAAGVSQPTIVRFATGIGCESFHDFRIQLAQSVALGVPATQAVIEADDGAAITTSKIFDFSITSLDHVRTQLDLDAISAAVDVLGQASHIVFIGLGASGIVAMDAEQKFPLFGVPCSSWVDTHQQFMTASTATPRTVFVVISNTGRTVSILDTVRVARDRGARVIGITGGPSPLADLSDVALIVESLDNTDVYTPTISRLAQLVVIDVLATLTLQRRDESALEDLHLMKTRLAHMRSGRQHEAVEAVVPPLDPDSVRKRP